MTETNNFFQFTALIVGLAALTVILSSQSYEQRSRFKDLPVAASPLDRQGISTARGLRTASHGAINPLDVVASRARN